MAAKNKPAPSPLAALIDELGSLEKELAPLKVKISRADALRKQLREAHDGLPAAAETIVSGERFRVIVGPRGNQTYIDYPALLKLVKPAAFCKFATCTLDALRTNVAAELVEKVTRLVQGGPRSLKVLENVAP